MGFTAAFLASLALTPSILYLSLTHHQRARAHQSRALHSSALLLTSITDADLTSELATMQDANYSGGFREGIRDYRVERAGLAERWKDQWNRDVAGVVGWVHGVNWRGIREGVEGRARGIVEGERRV